LLLTDTDDMYDFDKFEFKYAVIYKYLEAIKIKYDKSLFDLLLNMIRPEIEIRSTIISLNIELN